MHISTTRAFVLACFSLMATGETSFADSGPPPLHLASGGMLVGNFTVLHIADPQRTDDTDAFNALLQRSITFTIAFNSLDHASYAADPDGGKRWVITTGPAQVVFFGDPSGFLQNVVVPTFNCGIEIALREDVDGTTFLSGFNLSKAQVPQFFGFRCLGEVEVQRSSRSPVVQRADLDENVVQLERHSVRIPQFNGERFQLTDQATGVARYSLVENVPIAVDSRTFSEVKALYRTHY